MIPQIFETKDFLTVGLLVVLEALLSADNALVLAIIVRRLPKDLQKKALFYGLICSFTLRLTVLLLASSLLGFWWLQAFGGLYLIFLMVKHFVSAGSSKPHQQSGEGNAKFWPTIIQAELTDIAFALDSVLVAVAIEPAKGKIWVVYLGAMLGVVFLRWAATLVLRLLEKYPAMEHVAFALVGWAGIKLAILSVHSYEALLLKQGKHLAFDVPEMSPAVFWTGLLLIVGIGGFLARRMKVEEQTPEELAQEELLEEAFPTPETSSTPDLREDHVND